MSGLRSFTPISSLDHSPYMLYFRQVGRQPSSFFPREEGYHQDETAGYP